MDRQPIETAPRDGTKFLFLEKEGRIQVGRYTSIYGEPDDIYVSLTGYDGDAYPSRNVAHWMPLPEPPVSEAKLEELTDGD